MYAVCLRVEWKRIDVNRIHKIGKHGECHHRNVMFIWVTCHANKHKENALKHYRIGTSAIHVELKKKNVDIEKPYCVKFKFLLCKYSRLLILQSIMIEENIEVRILFLNLIFDLNENLRDSVIFAGVTIWLFTI